MKNRFLISLCVQLLLGIMFVFPVYSAEGFVVDESKKTLTEFFGSDDDSNSSKENKHKKSKISRDNKRIISVLKCFQNVTIIPNTICEADACSVFLLKYSQQIVDISFLKSIRSVVILS